LATFFLLSAFTSIFLRINHSIENPIRLTPFTKEGIRFFLFTFSVEKKSSTLRWEKPVKATFCFLMEIIIYFSLYLLSAKIRCLLLKATNNKLMATSFHFSFSSFYFSFFQFFIFHFSFFIFSIFHFSFFIFPFFIFHFSFSVFWSLFSLLRLQTVKKLLLLNQIKISKIFCWMLWPTLVIFLCWYQLNVLHFKNKMFSWNKLISVILQINSNSG